MTTNYGFSCFFFAQAQFFSSSQLPAELPDELLRAPFIWLRRGSVVPPLHGPYAVLQRGPAPSLSGRVGSRDEIISVSRLKACTDADTMSGSQRRRGRPPGKCPDSPTATKPVSFSDTLVSTPPAQ
jgi:hypothetical protein